MSQYYSRIHIRVKQPEVWKRFEDEDDRDLDLAELAEIGINQYTDSEQCWEEYEMLGIVENLAETLGEDGIIVADTTNINVDPYDYCVYYFGDKVKEYYWDSLEEEEIEVDDDNEWEDSRDMFSSTSIDKIAEWLNYARIKLTKQEKEKLKEFDIVTYKDKRATKFLENSDCAKKTYCNVRLRETRADDRIQYIEQNVKANDIVILQKRGDDYNKKKIEVVHKKKVIGSLPSDVGDELTMAIKLGTYQAKITEVKPLSQRNKHAKSPIISVKISI